MWPSQLNVRCQSCGRNVILPDGTKGEFKCAPDGEDWALPGSVTEFPALVTSHQNGFRNYSRSMGQKQGGG